MTLRKFSWVVLHCWVLSLLLFKAHGEGSGISVNFLEAPNITSRLNSARFSFNVWLDGQKVSVGENGPPCTGSNITCPCCCCPCPGSSNITCKLDNGITTDCGGKVVSYTGLQEGNHKFEVCSVSSPAVLCSTYSWIVDTVPPTAYITSPSSFTHATNVSVNISFTEPCTGEDGKDGFKCSENACNLLVHGYGHVIPSSLATLVPRRKYTLLVGFPSMVENGAVTLEMDNISCTDTAGNKFMKGQNSTFNISFDRGSVLVNLTSLVPEKNVSLESSGSLSLLATNNKEDLKLYLNFSERLSNTTTEVLNSLKISQGKLDPIMGENLGDRTYGFKVSNVYSPALINVSLDSKSIITKLGRPVSSIEPVTYLYDTRRPEVRLSTLSRTTRESIIPIWIDFSKPVLRFNTSNISIKGGRLLRDSFQDLYKSTKYTVNIQADDDVVYVNVPEDVAEDVFGNKNLAAAAPLEVLHYSDPLLSRVTSTIVTSTFGITCLAHATLAVSSASLVSTGAISGASSTLTSDPAANLFLSLSHIQLIALSRWLPLNLPVEYYEYAKALQWSIPYLNLPWEKEHVPVVHVKVRAGSGKVNQIKDDESDFKLCIRKKQKEEINSQTSAVASWKALQPMRRRPSFEECQSAFGTDGTKITGSLYLECLEAEAWQEFWRCVFWLAVFGGSAILLHALLIIIVRIRWPETDPQTQREPKIQRDMKEPQTQRELQIRRDLSEPQTQRESQTQSEPQEKRDYGVLTFPRFEIFCIIVALPCICKASAGLIKVGQKKEVGGKTMVAVGGVLLAVVGLILVSFFIFILVGVTLGMLFLYDEEYREQEAQKQNRLRYVGRLTLGLPLKGEWAEKNQSKKVYLRIFGPLFEDLRGLRHHMLPKVKPLNRRKYHFNPQKNGGTTHQVNPQKNGDAIVVYDDKTEDARGPGANPHRNGDQIITSDTDRTEDRRGPGGDPHNHGAEEAQDAEAAGCNPSKHGEIEDVETPQVNPQKNGDAIVAYEDKTEEARGPGANPLRNGDQIITSYNDKTEDRRGPGGDTHNKHGGGFVTSDEASLIRKLLDILGVSFIQMLFGALEKSFMEKLFGILETSFMRKLFGILRTYYILLESMRQVILGIMTGAFMGDKDPKSSQSRAAITLLSVTYFLLFFLFLLRPFVSKRGLLVEIISIACEVATFTLMMADKDKYNVCIVLLPFIGYVATLINQGYALYIQIKNLDQDGNNSFRRGMKRALSGLCIFFPLKVMEKLENYPPTEPGKQGTEDTGGSSSKLDEPGMKQPSEPTKNLSILSKRGSGNDPSSTCGNPSTPSPSKFGR